MTQEDKEIQERRERKSLQKKYDIPLTHFDFDYINKLKNLKELEKIYKILRSNEVGYYPDLTKCAEERLKLLNPNNRLLIKSVSALSKEYLEKDERDSLLKELENWKHDMEAKEVLLKNSKPNSVIQPVRRSSGKIEDSDRHTSEKKEERIKSCDYKSWDNYDAEKECLRIDLEEEKRHEEREKIERIEKEKEKERENMSLEEAEIDYIKEYVSKMTQEEREMLATKEKDMGNEYYKTHHLDEALKHYTRSVYMFPSITNYNNRAATYLKQCKFTKALADLNIVLKMDPKNVKACYRRAVAYQHKNEFQKALDDIRVVLAKEPNNVLARHFADRLREDCSSLPKKHRLKIRDEEGETHVKEVTEEEMLTNYKDKDFIEINEFGLPKIMCNCNGKYMDEPGIRHEENIRFQHIRQRKQYEHPCSRQSSSSSTHLKNEQPIALPMKDSTGYAGGGRRLDIVGYDGILDECEESSQTNCVVRDMRNTKDVKASANLNIAQSASANSDFDKSDKMSWNQRVKESTISEVEEYTFEDEDKEKEKNEESEEETEEIPKNCHVEMMDTDCASALNPDLEVGDKETWTQQWLQNTVSSVKNDFEKCMDLNENTNFSFEKGDTGELNSNETLGNCCTLNPDTLKPQNFLEKWSKLNTCPNKLESKVDLLKGVCPKHIPEVISLNLDQEILTDIINCLCYFYDKNYNEAFIFNYVHAVTKLKRFNIIICFVKEDVKTKIQNMLLKMGPKSDEVRKAFR